MPGNFAVPTEHFGDMTRNPQTPAPAGNPRRRGGQLPVDARPDEFRTGAQDGRTASHADLHPRRRFVSLGYSGQPLSDFSEVEHSLSGWPLRAFGSCIARAPAIAILPRRNPPVSAQASLDASTGLPATGGNGPLHSASAFQVQPDGTPTHAAGRADRRDGICTTGNSPDLP